MSVRSAAEITRAIDRLRDEAQVPLGELAGREIELNGVTIRPSAVVLLRWGRTGRAGVYLDVLFCRRRAAWVTSAAAVGRFRQAMSAVRL